jgi:peptidoglycan/LPS O-acetylase OafA/YrhL
MRKSMATNLHRLGTTLLQPSFRLVFRLTIHHMNDKNFAGLDVLRFFAAFIVCIYHIAFLSWIKPDSAASIISGNIYSFADWSGLMSAGWIGVEIFFVISGFVITFSAEVGAWHFLRSRILRLYPAVWFCAPIALLISLYFGAFAISELPTRSVRSLLLWPKGNWVDGVYWTLGIEMSFYFLVYLLLKLASQNSIRPMLVALGTLSATYWLLQLFAAYAWDINLVPDALKQGDPQRYMELSLIPHGCLFAIGGLSWNVICNQRSRWLWIAIGYSTLGALAEIHYTNLSKQAWVGMSSDSSLAQVIWLVCLMFLWASVAKRKLFEKFAPVSVTRIMGKMTYPLYLLHTTVGCAVLFECGQLGINRWMALLLSMITSLAASYVVACTIEPRLKTILANVLNALQFYLLRVAHRRSPSLSN